MPQTLNSFIAFAIAALALGNTAFADFSLVAKAKALPNEAEITIARHDIDQRSTSRILTAATNADGSLSLALNEEAGIFVIKIDGGSELTLAAAEGEVIALTLQDGNLSASGSPGTDILLDYEAARRESLARLVYPTRTAIKKAKMRFASEEEIAALTQAEVDAYQAHLYELNDFLIKNAGDTMALYGASLRLNGDHRAEELSTLVRRFAKKHGDIAASRSLTTGIQTSLQVAIGSIAPELIAKNVAGSVERLSDYRGRYILVDFWASWCPPCRVENQHYAKLVGSADRERFNIFAVNLDTNQRAWTRAVARDAADWIHISDLQGWTSPLASTYAVNALPASFLLDPEGKIIAKNLRGPALDAKLKELGIL